MIHKLYTVLLLSWLGGMGLPLSAQQYGYIQYHSDSGAPFDQVSSVLPDSEGFLWIGSDHGLYRFDGIEFEMYSLHTKSQYMHQLHAYGDDLLFLNEISLYRITHLDTEPEVTLLQEGSIYEQDDRPFYPNDFILDQNRDIWISQSNHTVGRWREGAFQNYAFSPSDQPQQLTVGEDARGGIWVLSPLDGLFYYDAASDTFVKKLDIKDGNTLLIHGDHLLVGSDALYIYSLRGNTPRLRKQVPMGDDRITALHVDQSGQYFVGTERGKLMRLPDLNSPPQTIYGANEAHRVEQLDFGHIYQIYVRPDSIGNNDQLWICSETGLWLLQQRFFKTVKNLPMNNPIHIAMGDQGKAWVPMSYLYEISPRGDTFSARTMLDNLRVNAVTYDRDGFLWVTRSTPRVELIKYEEDRVVRTYDFHERGEAIFYLYPDSKGNLWFCQAPVDKPIVGIARINVRGEVEYYDDTKGFSSRILAIKESSRGEIYAVGIGENSYLYRFDPEQDRFVNLSPQLPFEALLNFEAHDLTIDDRGVVWLATTDGLLRYDSEKITLIQSDLLGQEEVRGVTHYANNSIWVATATEGLVFHRDNTSTALGEQEGLPSVISAYRCITTDAEGRLWAGTPEGLVYSRISAATLPYSHTPRLRKVLIQQEERTTGADLAIRFRQQQEVEFQFSNLSFPAKKVQYQHRLLPASDRDIILEEQLWQSNGHHHTLKLSDINRGQYYLEVRARQPGGYQWSEPLELPLHVFQPWYLHPAFLYSSIALLLLGIGYYFRFYVRRRFRILQQGLKYSRQKLADKETQLLEKIREFEAQKEELAHANSNIQTLELFTKGIPRQASWEDIITAMGKAVHQSDDINAFEIAFKEKEEIVHRGYSDQERSGYTFRSKPFNPKNSLTCWAMEYKQEVLIRDYHAEHTMYIEEKEAYLFNSLIFVPFELENGQPVVLCAYSVKPNDLDQNDLIMFRILAQFIHFSIHRKLKKQL